MRRNQVAASSSPLNATQPEQPDDEGNPLLPLSDQNGGDAGGNDASVPSPPKGNAPSTSSSSITLDLGGQGYTLDPLRPLYSRRFAAIVKRTLKSMALIAMTPFIVTAFAIQTTFALLGAPWLQNAMRARFIPTIMGRVAHLFEKERLELLRNVQDGDVVLDVGCGGGAYLRHLTRAGKIVALEPATGLHGAIRKAASDVGIEGRLEIYPLDVETYAGRQEAPEAVEEGKDSELLFDWVILGNVLCEVECVRSTLQTIDGLLKKGGHIYFCEHVGRAKGTWQRRVQDSFNPFYRAMSGNCQINRDSVDEIRAVEGWEVISWEYCSFSVALGPFVLGLARKK